jgi:hypothetical protein
VILTFFVVACPASAAPKTIVGWIEKVRIYPGAPLIRAKLDTGAKHCSLNAPNITEFQRNGETWVRFSITSKSGEKVTLEQKVHRIASIKRHGSIVERRFAIRLGICLSTLYKEVEVNLVDRSDFLYPLLIGRNFMSGDLIVDSSTKFTTQPSCKDMLQP